jgi:hypothetical protein
MLVSRFMVVVYSLKESVSRGCLLPMLPKQWGYLASVLIGG